MRQLKQDVIEEHAHVDGEEHPEPDARQLEVLVGDQHHEGQPRDEELHVRNARNEIVDSVDPYQTLPGLYRDTRVLFDEVRGDRSLRWAVEADNAKLPLIQHKLSVQS